MIMKKQQWMFKVFSMLNSSSPSTGISIFNNVPRRLFCSAAITIATTPTGAPPPPVSNNISNKKKHEFNMLLEKKLPLLIVPYDHVTPIDKNYFPSREEGGGGGFVCDGTLGFINIFHDHDDDDQQLIMKKKKKKKKEVYDVYLPEIDKRRICGSSEGWLVTVHQNGEFQLLNPLTRIILHLPPFTTFPKVDSILPPFKSDEFIYKVVTNTTTTTTTNSITTTLAAAAAADTTTTVVDVIAMFKYPEGLEKGLALAFCRTTTTTTLSSTTENNNIEPAAAWITMPAKFPISLVDLSEVENEEYPCEVIDGVKVIHWNNDWNRWVDVTFYKGNFYTVDEFGMFGVIKGLDGPSPFVQILLGQPPEYGHCSDQSYLVEYPPPSSSSSSGGGGDLLMVVREIENIEKKTTQVDQTKEEEEEEIFERPYGTIGLKVLKLMNLNNGHPSWEEVTDLGEDCALFVGYNHSFSFSASKIPGCRGNCIYFTDSQPDKIFVYPDGGHDIGVYNLEEASFEKLDYETCSTQLFMPPPVWYVPN